MAEEINKRIAAGNRCFYGLNKIFWSKQLQRSAKIKVYTAILRPEVTNGCETWTLTQVEESKLATFEKKVLRRIFGPINENDTWRFRFNFEL